MLLEFKKVFLDEDEKIIQQCQVDMSSVDFNGSKPFISPINVNVRICNKSGIVRLKADVEFDFCYSCDRCTSDVKQYYKYSFDHIVVLSIDDCCSDEYIEASNYKLDLDELIIADILLELPHKILCKPDCKGLCMKCGKNLNEGACKCVAYQIDPRLEALKKLID